MRFIPPVLALLLVLAGVAAPADEPLLSAGQRYAKAGQWKQAEETLRRRLQAAPRDGDAVVLHAEALIHLGQPFDAVLELEQFLAAVPDSVPALTLYGALLVDVMDEPGRAEEAFRKATGLGPKDWQAWEGLGKLLLGRRKPAEAVRCLQTASELAPRDADVASELARALEELDDGSQAEAAHRRALILNESNPRPLATVYSRFATFFSERDKGNESLSLFDKAIALDAHSADSLYGRAAAREKLGRLRDAEADALAALREAPARRDVRQLLIRIYRGLGDNAKVDEQVAAIKKQAEAEQAELSRFRQMRTSLNAAERLLAEGRYREAVSPYEKVVELVPTFYEAWFALGVCYSQADDPGKAEAALKRYLEFQPLSGDGHSALGLLYFAEKRVEEARTQLSRALELNPELDEARTALAKLTLDGGDQARALSLLAPLLSRAEPPAEAEVYSIAASAHFQTGKRDEAFAVCEEGLRRHPESEKLEELHASFLVACGRTEACRLRAAQWYSARPRSPRYLRCVAELLLMNKPLDDETERIVRRIAAESPNEALSHYLLGKWARARSRFDLARDEAVRAAELAKPGDDAFRVQCLTLEALAREALTDYAAGEAAFRKAWDLNRALKPPSAEAAMWYVQFLLESGRPEEASERAREVLGWQPKYGPAHFALARVHENAGRRDEAARAAEAALKLGLEDPQQERAAHALLAKIYYATGRTKEAAAHQAWVKAH